MEKVAVQNQNTNCNVSEMVQDRVNVTIDCQYIILYEVSISAN